MKFCLYIIQSNHIGGKHLYFLSKKKIENKILVIAIRNSNNCETSFDVLLSPRATCCAKGYSIVVCVSSLKASLKETPCTGIYLTSYNI